MPLIDQAARALDGLSRREQFTEDDDLVFVSGRRRATSTATQLRQALPRARSSAAGLKRMRFHDLRHTFGTLAVQAFPLSDVQACMGHADIATTMRLRPPCPAATTRPTGSPALVERGRSVHPSVHRTQEQQRN